MKKERRVRERCNYSHNISNQHPITRRNNYDMSMKEEGMKTLIWILQKKNFGNECLGDGFIHVKDVDVARCWCREESPS